MTSSDHNDNRENFEYEATDSEGGESIGKDREKKLREKLKQCEKERQEYLEGWQRAKADFVNAKKEEEKSRQVFRDFIREDTFMQMLPVVDSFEAALRGKPDSGDPEWQRGIEHIHKQLLSVLESNNIQQINPKGEVFDPGKHEAVSSVPTDKEDEDGKIVSVEQKGYELRGRILRPARVKVARFTKS